MDKRMLMSNRECEHGVAHVVPVNDKFRTFELAREPCHEECRDTRVHEDRRTAKTMISLSYVGGFCTRMTSMVPIHASKIQHN